MSEDCDSTGTIGPGNEFAEPDPDPDQRLTIEIVVHSGDWPDLDALEKLAMAVAREVANERVLSGHIREAALALSSDDAVRTLNRTYRGQDKPTNVLSFPAPAAEIVATGTPAGRFIGDIVLAGETVRREAAERGIPFVHHFAHLVAHGLFHLFGFDHHDDTTAHEMEAMETEVLRRLGIPDPYATDQSEEEALGSAG